jgi:DNA-binding response OmpR family regulator
MVMTNQEKILVIEDDLKSLQLIEDVLVDKGYTILTTTRGDEALKILEADSAIHVLLLDWMIPGINGLELLKRVKAHPRLKYIPVIIQTAKTNKDDILEGIAAGAFYYLTKPFDLDFLYTLVQAALDDYQLYQSMQEQQVQLEQVLSWIQRVDFEFQTIKEGYIIRVLEEPYQMNL